MCFKRVRTAKLLARGFTGEPKWIDFVEDAAVNKLNDNEPTGTHHRPYSMVDPACLWAWVWVWVWVWVLWVWVWVWMWVWV